MHKIRSYGKREGQGIVEFALVLPFLLLLIIGMVDVGYAFYDYMELVGANREGVRLGSRGRFEDPSIATRVVNAGGILEVGGEPKSKYITSGPNSNFGLIITRFPIDVDGSLDYAGVTRFVTGTLTLDDGSRRPIVEADSRIDDAAAYESVHGDITGKINERRVAEDYEPQESEIIVIETFYAHEPFFPTFMDLLQMPSPLTLYQSAGMRVMRDSRND
ncbi:MAG: TadE family protein [Anaerolineales bacterium]